jgi:hypothetical protein
VLAQAEQPTAIVLVNETISVGLYRGLSEAGVRPSRDIAVIGRDSPHANFLSPPLTCFGLSLRDLGIALAEKPCSRPCPPTIQAASSANSGASPWLKGKATPIALTDRRRDQPSPFATAISPAKRRRVGL